MFNQCKEKTALGASNTQSGKEIKTQDFIPNYTGHGVELSMGKKPNLTCEETREKYPNVAKLVAFVGEQGWPTQFAALLLVIIAGLTKEVEA